MTQQTRFIGAEDVNRIIRGKFKGAEYAARRVLDPTLKALGLRPVGLSGRGTPLWNADEIRERCAEIYVALYPPAPIESEVPEEPAADTPPSGQDIERAVTAALRAYLGGKQMALPGIDTSGLLKEIQNVDRGLEVIAANVEKALNCSQLALNGQGEFKKTATELRAAMDSMEQSVRKSNEEVHATLVKLFERMTNEFNSVHLVMRDILKCAK